MVAHANFSATLGDPLGFKLRNTNKQTETEAPNGFFMKEQGFSSFQIFLLLSILSFKAFYHIMPQLSILSFKAFYHIMPQLSITCLLISTLRSQASEKGKELHLHRAIVFDLAHCSVVMWWVLAVLSSYLTAHVDVVVIVTHRHFVTVPSFLHQAAQVKTES